MGFLGSHLSEVLAIGGIDDTPRGVHKQTAILRHTILAYLLQRTSLGANAWHKQEMVGNHLTDIFKHSSLRSTNDIHHILVVAPLLTLFQHFLKESFAIGVFRQLEVVRAFIARQRQQDHPFVVVAEEWCDAVFTHVGGDGECIDIVLLKEGLGIHFRCVADITTLGISDDEVVGIFFFQIVDGCLKSQQTIHSISLVESEVGLVGHAIGGCGIDDESVELAEGTEHIVLAVLGLCLVDDALWNFVDICIETYAEKTLLLANLFYQLLSVHCQISSLNS